MAVGDDRVTLELIGARLLALTAEVRDLQHRFDGMETRLGVLELRFSGMETRLGALEARFSGLESRFGAQEERITRLLVLVVRIAERVGTQPE